MTVPASKFAAGLPMRAQPFVVLVGDDDGSDVTAADATDDVQLVSLTRSAGGHALDHATLTFSLGLTGTHLVDKTTPFSFSRKVEVQLAQDPTADQSTPPVASLFCGELAIEKAKIDRKGEYCLLTARLEPWHFGDPLLGPKFVDRTSDPTLHTGVDLANDLDVVFNPEIDGLIKGNMSAMNVDSEGNRSDDHTRGVINAGADLEGWYQAWLDPESVRSGPALTVQDQTPALWDLANAVNSLCLAANPNETFVVNPEYDDLAALFEDAPDIRDVKLPRGKRLPELLDALLPRFGYNWYVKPAIEDDGSDTPPSKNHIKIYKLGDGPQVQVYLQRPATPAPNLDPTQSNVPDFEVEWNIADLSNDIIAQGTFKEYEATFELYRAWPEADDDLSADQLRKTDETSAEDATEDSVFMSHVDTWRKWVLNEAGDYCLTRKEVAAIPATPYDLKPLLGSQTVVKRRRFHHCLTWGQDGERRDVYVQYRDTSVANDTDPGAWKSLAGEEWSNISFHVLEKECGIYFSGNTPPPDLMDLGDKARIRVTAAIRGDTRLEYEAVKTSFTPNLNTIRLFVDLSDRFHYRQIQRTGANASVIAPKQVPISSVTFGGPAGTSAFGVSGDQTSVVPPPTAVRVTGSTGNDGLYSVKSFTYSTGQTVYTVNEAVPEGIADGTLTLGGDDTVDDTLLITDYAQKLQKVEQSCRLTCEFEVFGIQTQYEIGQLVTNLKGREISLNRNSVLQSEKLYPQITSITYDRARQMTKLRVEEFDFSRPQIRKLSL